MNEENLINERVHLLAISGSLRAASSNTTLLRAAIQLAPPTVEIELYAGLGDLPYFNPDLDTDSPPRAVSEFRARLNAADGILICSPEYAHGVPGVLKNALDWIVSSGELMHKPVALLNASFASTHAHAALSETLSVMMARLDSQTSLRIGLPGNKISTDEIIAHPELSQALRTVITELAQAAREFRSE